jgi:hypothetical protein
MAIDEQNTMENIVQYRKVIFDSGGVKESLFIYYAEYCSAFARLSHGAAVKNIYQRSLQQ